jgi:hypothetical protein
MRRIGRSNSSVIALAVSSLLPMAVLANQPLVTAIGKVLQHDGGVSTLHNGQQVLFPSHSVPALGSAVRVTGPLLDSGVLSVLSWSVLHETSGIRSAAFTSVASVQMPHAASESAFNTFGVTGSNVAGVTGSNVAGVTGSNVAGVTGSNVAGVTGSNVAGVTGSNVAGVTGSNLAGVTGSNVAGVTGSNLAGVTGSN